MNNNDLPLYMPPRKPNYFGNMTAKEIGREVAAHKLRINRAVEGCNANAIQKFVLGEIIKDTWAHNRDPASVLGLKNRVPVYPGKRRLAWRISISEVSVGRALSFWKKAGCIVAVGYEKGGRNATRYLIDDKKIMSMIARPYVRSETTSKPHLNHIRTTSKPHLTDARYIGSIKLNHKEENTHGNVIDLAAVQKPEKERVL